MHWRKSWWRTSCWWGSHCRECHHSTHHFIYLWDHKHFAGFGIAEHEFPKNNESTWQFMTLPCSSKCTRHWLSVSQRESTNFFCKYDFKNVLHWQAQKKRQSGEDTKEENNFNHQSFQNRCKLRRNFQMNTR